MIKVQDKQNQEFKVPDVTNLKVSNKPAEQPKVKTIIFCIPGKVFNSRFLLSWSDLLLQCIINGYRPILCQEHDKNIYISRNKCLGGNILSNDPEQKPFQGRVNYDYLVWVDPYVTFTYKDLEKLLESPYDVTSGLYTFNQQITNVVQEFNYEFYKKNGIFNFLTYDNLVNVQKEDNRYFPVDFVDMGWMCFKQGIAEKLQYPWFEPNTTQPVGIFTETYAYCMKLKEAGVQVMVDSNTKMRYIE
tara:strand:- start:31 stop:765 length:735 start_codon:yes stop_codon:yes gene_type:complete